MDEILEVNHVTIRGISHHDASAILRNTPTNVHLALGRSKNVVASKRRSAADRDMSLESSSSLERFGSDPSLFKSTQLVVPSDGSGSLRDSPVPRVFSQDLPDIPQPIVVRLVKVSFLYSEVNHVTYRTQFHETLISRCCRLLQNLDTS